MMPLLHALMSPENLVAILTLTALEIVLGIDNIIFLSILTGKVAESQRRQARLIGLSGAMVARIALLLGITWVMGLTRELFTLFDHGVSGKDIILICGGLFLIAKSTHEIHDKVENPHAESAPPSPKGKGAFGLVLIQIVLVDLVFSLDSVITAVGMVNPAAAAAGLDAEAAALIHTSKIAVMVIAVIIAIIVMMAFAGRIGDFVERHPTIKVLALSFLILIGVMLVGESFGHHIPKAYIYFSMAFSLAVEGLNMRMRAKPVPVPVPAPVPISEPKQSESKQPEA
jgi:predicted tellurium resistance membrane protein TerC